MANPYVGSNMTGANSPSISADKDTYTGVVDTFAEAVDKHDHTPGKGLAIGTNGISDGAITTNKLANGAVNATKITAGSITTTQIAADGVRTANIQDGNVTQSKLAARTTGTSVVAGGVAISNSSGVYNGTGSRADVTNLSVTITTTGRPVRLMLIPDGSGTPAGMGCTTANGTLILTLMRGASDIANFGVGGVSSASSYVPPGAVDFIDVVAAGTYTYKLQAVMSLASASSVSSVKLVAYEL